MKPTDMIRGGYLYRRIETKYDAIGKRYKMIIRKYWIDYYSRKSYNQYGVAYTELHIFISAKTPIIQDVSNKDWAIKDLKENWLDVFEYAISKSEPEWIKYSETDKYICDSQDKEEAIQTLEIDPEIFSKIRLVSPYS